MYGVLVSVAVNALILKYVLENEKENCECAMTWHHNFIKLYAPVVIFLAFVRLLFKNELDKAMNTPVFKVLFGVLGLVSMAYSITLLVYFFKLKLSECKCSKDWKRKMLIFPLIVMAIALILVFLITTVLALTGKKMLKNGKK